MSNAHYLPPQALNDWLLAASAELGLSPELDAIAIVLDLARDVAHDVTRPAAPLSAYLLGLAVGASSDGSAVLPELAQKLVTLAAEWEASPEIRQ